MNVNLHCTSQILHRSVQKGQYPVAEVVWTKMPCGCEGSGDNGQTGSRWQKGNFNSNNYWLQPRNLENISECTTYATLKMMGCTAAELHLGCQNWTVHIFNCLYYILIIIAMFVFSCINMSMSQVNKNISYMLWKFWEMVTWGAAEDSGMRQGKDSSHTARLRTSFSLVLD